MTAAAVYCKSLVAMPVKALQAPEDRYAVLSQTSRLRDFKNSFISPFSDTPFVSGSMPETGCVFK